MGIRPDDYRIQKRRYSCFYGTDLEILLKGLKVETLLLVGGLGMKKLERDMENERKRY